MADSLKELAVKLATQGPHKTLPTPRLIRLLFNGEYIVRTTKAIFVWEHPFFPQLYIPASEFATKTSVQITPEEVIEDDGGKEVAETWKVIVGSRHTERVVKFSDDLSGELKGLVKVDFKSMDAWFEEDTPIFVHPKDPFKRVDILSSTRPIKIRIGGKVVAQTTTSMHLYETGLPTRYYIPFTAIDASVLRKSATTTECPYKGTANYYDVVIGGETWENVVWYYNSPLLESAKVEGLCCFYNEKVDIELDGQLLERPVTHFGGGKGK